jgi:hypothetical protein
MQRKNRNITTVSMFRDCTRNSDPEIPCATVLYHIARFGIARQSDEGAAAHIWQLLMAGQLPVVAFYAVNWVPRAPGTALRVLALQVGVALAALAPVYWLGW